MRKKVLCDIDGVLNEPKENLARLYHEKKFDELVQEMIQLPLDETLATIVKNIHSNYDLIFLTARHKKYREQTYDFLKSFLGDIPFMLSMRCDNDGDAIEQKRDFVLRNFSKDDIAYAIEDRKDMAKMYESMGIHCFIVKQDVFSKKENENELSK